MAERRKYTDQDRARVNLALTVNQGNIKRTARETGIPVSTVRLWKKELEENGPSTEVALLTEEQADQFVQDSERVRGKMLSALEEAVDRGDVKARELITGVGVLTDKINVARGLTRGQGETRPAIEPAAMRELARGLVEGAVAAAKRREEEIEEAEFVEVELPAIPSGTS